MNQQYRDNKRIAKNTMLLYLRMFILMAISLYTSRITLQYLGVDNFGIYNVIGGIVFMFSILSTSMTTAISRYITVELGQNDFKRLKLIFSTALNVQLSLSIIILILGEILGIWFITNKMSIPEGRIVAAQWSLHCALATFIIGLLSIPYNSIIVAYEKMSIFAYISILEAILKLAVSFSLILSPFDKLKTYAILLVICQLIIQIIYIIYCKQKFKECHYSFCFEKKIFKTLWSFAGWNLLGNGASILNNQGVNLIMNIFFGVVVNAARGIASQVNNAVQQFVSNFTMALNPPIIKSYATGDKIYSFDLACKGAKYSYSLMLIISLPILIESDQILELWLNTPPKNSSLFLNWTIITSLASIVGQSLVTLILANGNIKRFQIIFAIIGFLPFPLSWLAFQWGFSAVSAFIINFICYYILIYIRLWLAHNIVGIKYSLFFKEVIIRVHLTTLASVIAPLIITSYLAPSFFCLIISCLISIISVSASTYFLVLDKNERLSIKKYIETNFLQKIRIK